MIFEGFGTLALQSDECADALDMKRLDFTKYIPNDTDNESGAIKRPITMANSYELPYDPSNLNWSDAEKNLYT